MIDPTQAAQVLGCVGATLKILYEIQKTYQDSTRVLQKLTAEAKIIQNVTEHVKSWIDIVSASADHTFNSLQNVGEALQLVAGSLLRLNNDLRSVQSNLGGMLGSIGTSAASRLIKARYVFKEGTMKKHLKELKDDSAILQLVLQVTQLRSPEEVMQRSQEVALGLRAIQDGRSPLDNWDHASAAFKQFLDIIEANRRADSLQQSLSMSADQQTAMDDDVPPPYEAHQQPAIAPVGSSRLFPHVPNARADAMSEPDQDASELGANQIPIDTETRRPTVATDFPTDSKATYSDNSITSSPVTETSVFASSSSSHTGASTHAESQMTTLDVNGSTKPDQPQTFNEKRHHQSPASSERTYESISSVQPSSSRSANSSSTTVPRVNDSTDIQPVADDTPLHKAVLLNDLPACKRLLAAGAQVTVLNRAFDTPLSLAAVHGFLDVARFLHDNVSKKANDPILMQAFLAAVENGQISTARMFFENGLVLRRMKKDAYRPLALAAKNGSIEMIDLMLRNSASFKEKDERGWTALHYATYYGNAQASQRLIENGQSVKSVTIKGETPLHFAVKSGSMETFDVLMRQKNTPVNAADKQDEDPLHLAVRTGSLGMVKALLSRTTKVSNVNAWGWQPIHIASAYGHEAILKLLCSSSTADIEAKITSTPYHKDKSSNTHPSVETGHILEAHWPFPGSRPLHLTIEHNHDTLTTFLLTHGAKPNSSCTRGWRPLHHASFTGNPSALTLLLTHSADPHVLTNDNKTPLDLLCAKQPLFVHPTTRLDMHTALEQAMQTTPKRKITDMAEQVNAIRIKSKTVIDLTQNPMSLVIEGKDAVGVSGERVRGRAIEEKNRWVRDVELAREVVQQVKVE